MTSRVLENVKIYLLSQAVTRYCMVYFGNSPKIGFGFLEYIIYSCMGIRYAKLFGAAKSMFKS